MTAAAPTNLGCARYRPSSTATVDSTDTDCKDSREATDQDPTGDCNDGSASIHPKAAETCDGVDQDCDGTIDEGVTTTWYKDGDGDGYGGSNSGTTQACSRPGGYSATDNDCDDADRNAYPGATEVTGDGIDENCDGKELCYRDADDDGYRPDSTSTVSTSDLDCIDAGEAMNTDPTGDCRDDSAAINPGVTEVCNSVDDDCDGSTDEGVTTRYYYGQHCPCGGYWCDPDDYRDLCAPSDGYRFEVCTGVDICFPESAYNCPLLPERSSTFEELSQPARAPASILGEVSGTGTGAGTGSFSGGDLPSAVDPAPVPLSWAVPVVEVEPGVTAPTARLDGDIARRQGGGIADLDHAIAVTQYEVTQAVWWAVMGGLPTGISRPDPALPIDHVTWFEALEFANELSLLEGLEPAYVDSDEDGLLDTWLADASGFRLPTDREWEYSARAGTPIDLYRGGLSRQFDCTVIDPFLSQIGWYCGNADGALHAVGERVPNRFGLYDTSGNVWEWVWVSDDELEVSEEEGSRMSMEQAIRGGAADSLPRECRSASREVLSPAERERFVGLRLVRDLE